MARCVGNDNRANGKLFGDRRCVQRPTTAVGDQSKVTRVEAALKSHMTHRVSHCGSSDLQHTRCDAFQRKVERLGKSVAQSGVRRMTIKTHFTAEKAFRRKPAKDNIRIGDRRLDAAAAVARWTGPSASARRA